MLRQTLIKLIAKRLLLLLPLLLAVACGAFVLVRLAPGDFLTELRENPQISAETLATLRQQHGLDQPLPTQFGKWLWRAAQGDLGYSLIYYAPVSTLIRERLFNTIWLAGASLALAWLAALPLGVFVASGRAPWLDHGLASLSALLLAAPSFLLALLFLLFAARTNWFPLGGVVATDSENLAWPQRWADFAWHLALPALVLALRQFPHYFQQVRASVRECLTQDYIVTARAKGLSEGAILFKHALKPAANALITQAGNSLGALLSGAFIVEAVLSWPGLGGLTVNALLSRDVFVLLACLLWAALLLALGNLLADVLLLLVDPRLRRS
ncbi:MAG: ABC transporter permease [Acidobacteria bacterium]|nr:ABC transporter permease [Acidobacteriota bacterium]MBI3422379.1 ABC transporter permease [Acidobacteriota bacterium]